VTAARVGHTSGRTVSEKPKNKVGKRVLFFVVETQDTFTRRSPHPTTISPQKHHTETAHFAKPPSKMPGIRQKIGFHQRRFFS